jgi:hypothetical protein
VVRREPVELARHPQWLKGLNRHSAFYYPNRRLSARDYRKPSSLLLCAGVSFISAHITICPKANATHSQQRALTSLSPISRASRAIAAVAVATSPNAASRCACEGGWNVTRPLRVCTAAEHDAHDPAAITSRETGRWMYAETGLDFC